MGDVAWVIIFFITVFTFGLIIGIVFLGNIIERDALCEGAGFTDTAKILDEWHCVRVEGEPLLIELDSVRIK